VLKPLVRALDEASSELAPSLPQNFVEHRAELAILDCPPVCRRRLLTFKVVREEELEQASAFRLPDHPR
jgi:hypothetical protein